MRYLVLFGIISTSSFANPIYNCAKNLAPFSRDMVISSNSETEVISLKFENEFFFLQGKEVFGPHLPNTSDSKSCSHSNFAIGDNGSYRQNFESIEINGTVHPFSYSHFVPWNKGEKKEGVFGGFFQKAPPKYEVESFAFSHNPVSEAVGRPECENKVQLKPSSKKEVLEKFLKQEIDRLGNRELAKESREMLESGVLPSHELDIQKFEQIHNALASCTTVEGKVSDLATAKLADFGLNNNWYDQEISTARSVNEIDSGRGFPSKGASLPEDTQRRAVPQVITR